MSDNTTESPFITLALALGDHGAIVRVRVRRVGASRETILKGKQALCMATKCMALDGERYGNGWAASNGSAKSLGYATVLISIEEFSNTPA